jgi:hypothetical protein
MASPDHLQQVLQQQQTTINALAERINELTRSSNVVSETCAKSSSISFKQCLNFIPHYNGNPIELISFIKCVERIYNNYCVERNDTNWSENQWALIQCITMKLHGPAHKVIIQKRCDSVPSILETLRNNFADNRTAIQLLGELANFKYHKGQHPLEYVNQIETKVVTIISRYELDGVDGPVLKELSNQVEKQAYKVLTSSLPRSLGLFLVNQKTSSLEEVRQVLINDAEIVLDDLGFSTDPNEKQHRRNFDKNYHKNKDHHNQKHNYNSHNSHEKQSNNTQNHNQNQMSNRPPNYNSNQEKRPWHQNSGQWKNSGQYRNSEQWKNKSRDNQIQKPNPNWKPTVKEDESMRTVSNFQKLNQYHTESLPLEGRVEQIEQSLNSFLEVGSYLKEEPPSN